MAAVDDHFADLGWHAPSLQQACYLVEAAECVGRNGLARLAFDQERPLPGLRHCVRLLTISIAEERHIGDRTAVQVGLDDLRQYPRFEDGTTQWMEAQLFRAADSQQIADQSRVVEMQLGRLEKSLANVAKIRWQAEANVAGLEHAQPASSGVVRDPGVAAQGRKVEQLPGSSGAQAQEGLESQQV